jgi:thiol-disulfide isomerase/thioredoxin
MSPGVVVLVVAVVAALAFGSWRALTDGRFRGTRVVRRAVEPVDPEPGPEPDAEAGQPVLAGTAWATGLGERATLLQFSSAFCAPCRATRRTLEEVARIVPGVVHIEVDAEQHLDLVRRVGILRTPTTVVLDPAGREVSRAAGAPSKQAVIAGLGWVG